MSDRPHVRFPREPPLPRHLVNQKRNVGDLVAALPKLIAGKAGNLRNLLSLYEDCAGRRSANFTDGLCIFLGKRGLFGAQGSGAQILVEQSVFAGYPPSRSIPKAH